MAQFKQKYIQEKVDNMMSSYRQTRPPSQYQRQAGHSLTPLLQGKIQYDKLLKKYNMEAVKEELLAHGITFESNTTWRSLIGLLKEDERKKQWK
eukprot:11474993-Ditylum_brightwellii.AAC.1